MKRKFFSRYPILTVYFFCKADIMNRTTLREQIEQARDATREAEKKSQDFESRLEAATTSLRAEKEVASALAATRAEELAKVQADYEKAKTDSENRLRIGLNWKRRVDTLNEQIGNTAKAHLEAISEREKKVEEAEKKVKAAEEEVQTLKKKVEETEGTMQRLQIELANTQKSEGQAQGQAQADSTALVSSCYIHFAFTGYGFTDIASSRASSKMRKINLPKNSSKPKRNSKPLRPPPLKKTRNETNATRIMSLE